jgi:hypothetical protein
MLHFQNNIDNWEAHKGFEKRNKKQGEIANYWICPMRYGYDRRKSSYTFLDEFGWNAFSRRRLFVFCRHHPFSSFSKLNLPDFDAGAQ